MTPGSVTITILPCGYFVGLCLRGLVSSPFHTLSAESAGRRGFICAACPAFTLSMQKQDDIFRGNLSRVSGKKGSSTGCLWPCFEGVMRKWSGVELPRGLPVVG